MANGTIKTIHRDKGFGFIKANDQAIGAADLFFHRTAVEGMDLGELREGQQVVFEVGADPRDPSRSRAVNVRLVTAEE